MPGFVLAKAPNSAFLWRAGAGFDGPGELRGDRHANREPLMQVSTTRTSCAASETALGVVFPTRSAAFVGL
eukprot:2309623-Rhodomonas_salina.1